MTSPSTSTATPAVVAVSGNPRRASRTAAVARSVAGRVAALAPSDLGPVAEIELAELAGDVFAVDHPRVDAALAALAAARVAVIATPVYKASYTGLLKSFLDLYGPDGLAGVVAVPVVVSASPTHALAAEVHLRPLLVELGATVPTRAVSVTEAQLGDLDSLLDRWAVGAAPLLQPFLSSSVSVPQPATNLVGAR